MKPPREKTSKADALRAMRENKFADYRAKAPKVRKRVARQTKGRSK